MALDDRLKALQDLEALLNTPAADDFFGKQPEKVQEEFQSNRLKVSLELEKLENAVLDSYVQKLDELAPLLKASADVLNKEIVALNNIQAIMTNLAVVANLLARIAATATTAAAGLAFGARTVISQKDVDAYWAARRQAKIKAQAMGGKMTLLTVSAPPAAGGMPPAAGGAPPKADDFKDRLAKYIPADVIAAFLAADSAAVSARGEDLRLPALRWTIFTIALVFTPLYLRFALKVPKKIQLVLSTLSFAVWVLALPGNVFTTSHPEIFHPIYGTLFLPFFTLAVTMIQA